MKQNWKEGYVVIISMLYNYLAFKFYFLEKHIVLQGASKLCEHL